MALDELEGKAIPDEGTLAPGEFESLAGQKVQLDIDDAPFLLDPDDEPAALPATVDKVAPAPTPTALGRKKKWIIIGLILLLVLILAGGAAWYFLKPGQAPLPPLPEPTVIVVPSKPAPSIPKEYSMTLEPFWVPLVTQTGELRFLVATFVLSTSNGLLFQELEDKILTVRDSIFYYMRNKEYEFLMNPDNAEIIRADLLGSVNNYIVQGELENLYFDSYLVQ